MKNYINKSAKRILSLALALVMLAGCLFTANVGVGITAAAETDPYADWDNVQYWDGTYLSNFSTFKQEDVDGDGVKEYIIENAAQLQFAAAGTRARSTADSSLGKKFVIDPTIDAFIMQPKAAVDKLGIAAFVELSGAEETREFFEETYTAAGYTPVNWVKDGNSNIFAGDFDGSGVPIYGIYADGIARGNEHAAFFLAINGGGTSSTYTDITLENIVIKNSYFKSFRRTGILTSIVWGDNGTRTIVDSCVFGNCYLFGQNLYTKGTTTYLRSSTTDGTIVEDIGAMGIVAATVSNAPIQMSNSLVYGNASRYDFYTATATSQDNPSNMWEHTVNDTTTISEPTTTYDAFNWAFRENKNNPTTKKYYGSVKNCIILDAVVNNLQADSTEYCENVYSDTPTGYTKVTKLFDGESTKGSAGMYWVPGLAWGNEWFAVEGEYPSPFEPDNYDSSITASTTGYDGGNGTKDDPYIIHSADQLYKMATEQSYTEIKTDNWDLYTKDGVADPKTTDNYVSKYYKVADGVDAIYINDVETKAEVEALVEKGGYNYWNPKNETGSGAFSGYFDGNGVTIYGMISTSTGFVNKIDGENATIKNVHFKAAHVSTSGKAAVVTTEFTNYGVSGYVYNTEKAAYEQVWKNRNSVYTIANVVVTESYIKTTRSNSGKGSSDYVPTAGGIVAIDTTPSLLKMEYCLFDGGSCTLIDGDDATANYNPNSSKAGIVSTVSNNTNNWELSNCVSIDAAAVSMQTGGTYTRYKSGAIKLNAVYGIYNDALSKENYPVLANSYNIEGTSFSMLDMPLLNWVGTWDLVEYNGRMIPMPKTSHNAVDDYSTQLVKQNGGSGMNNVVTNEGYVAGTYGMYEEFLGSGTKDDPYIISNALDLARAIACGGKNQYSKLHYKLSCDIDVGASWINENTIAGKYEYVPFEGHIDGDGHTIYNLVSIGENAGLIPTIVGGASIKNLHIRNSNIIDTTKDDEDDENYGGAFFGEYQSDQPDENGTKVTIEGCSFESAGVEGVNFLVGNFEASTIINSYAINSANKAYRYYESYQVAGQGDKYTSGGNNYRPNPENAAFYGEEGVENPVWYKGGKGGCNPQLVNRAKAMTEIDISGYGDSDYDSDDIVSLRQRLLGNPAFANVYGDVNRDGKTNLGDLAILRRQLVDTYNMYADGFWRNAALGNVVIYYGENDNYDFARKLELVLEDAFGEDVKKVVVGNVGVSGITYGNKSENGKLYVHKNDIYTDGTNYYKFNENATTGAITPVVLDPEKDAAEIAKYALDGNCQIVVGNVTGYDNNTLGDNNYLISYDKTKAAVWLQGGSFTAVEQATIDFINKSNPDSSYVYTTDGAVALDANKVAKTVGGNTYYYAWGDEFTGGELKLDNWRHAGMHSESSPDNGGKFDNLEVAYADDMAKLYEVTTDDKLKIWRGYYGAGTEAGTWADGQGYQYLGTMADNIGTNEFNGTVEDNDTYVTAGKIDSLNSVLAKQGYIEFNVKYPSDGNVFACLWMYGVRLGQTNAQISDGLYSKVLKLNNAAAYADGKGAGLAWDGTTNKMDSRYPSTYKYQMPNASYEIDVVELMQSGSSNNMKNTYKTANFTFHKYVDGGVYDDNGTSKVKFIDWDNVFATNSAKHFSVSSRIKSSNYVTNVTTDTFLTDTVTEWKLGYDSGVVYNWNGGMKRYDTDKGTIFSGTPFTTTAKNDMMKVGVEWDTTDPDTMLFKFYIDGTVVGTVKENIKYDEDITFSGVKSETGFLEKLSDIVSDASTANQYMYLLIDNTFYTSESGRDTAKILTQESGDTTVMEIDYVRIYQKDGRRDIVTPETEEFNNGNHFGY